MNLSLLHFLSNKIDKIRNLTKRPIGGELVSFSLCIYLYIATPKLFFTFFLHFHTELKAFLVDLKEQWLNKQKHVEEKFLELDEESKVQGSLPKKRKRRKKTEPQEQLSDPFAKCAAEIQIEMFTKVELRILHNSCKYVYITQLERF